MFAFPAEAAEELLNLHGTRSGSHGKHALTSTCIRLPCLQESLVGIRMKYVGEQHSKNISATRGLGSCARTSSFATLTVAEEKLDCAVGKRQLSEGGRGQKKTRFQLFIRAH